MVPIPQSWRGMLAIIAWPSRPRRFLCRLLDIPKTRHSQSSHRKMLKQLTEKTWKSHICACLYFLQEDRRWSCNYVCSMRCSPPLHTHPSLSHMSMPNLCLLHPWLNKQMFLQVTPAGVAIGIGLGSSYNGSSKAALASEGVFDSVSAGTPCAAYSDAARKGLKAQLAMN